MAATKSWTLTDVTHDLWVDHFHIQSDHSATMDNRPWSIQKRTLRGGLRDGVDIIEIDNGSMQFSILPTRGMSIWRGACQGTFLGWQSPIQGPVNPKFVNELDRGSLGWLQGFDEWIVRCGLDSNGSPGTDVIIDNNGNPAEVDLTLHGKIANLPAHYVEIQIIENDPPELVVIGHVDESMLFSPQLRMVSTIRTQIGSNRLTITDEIINIRSTPVELELLYHCNFGAPFLEEGAQLKLPIREVAPRDKRAQEGMAHFDTYQGPEPGFVEQVYWYDLASEASGKTLAMLRNAHGDKGAVLRFNKQELPYFTQWKNTAPVSDGFVTGIEPGTNFPNLKRFERDQGRVIRISPGNHYSCTLDIDIHVDPDSVASVENEIQKLQSSVSPLIHKQPHKKYSPHS